MIKFKKFFFALLFSFFIFFLSFSLPLPVYASISAKTLTMDDLNRLEKITFYNSTASNLISLSPAGVSPSQVPAYSFQKSSSNIVSTDGGSIRAEYKSIGKFKGRDISAVLTFSDFCKKTDQDFINSQRDGRYLCVPSCFTGELFYDGDSLKQTLQFYYTDDTSKSLIDVSNAFITIHELNLEEYAGMIGASEIFLGEDTQLCKKDVSDIVCYGNGVEPYSGYAVPENEKRVFSKNGVYYEDDRNNPLYHVDSVLFKLKGNSNVFYIEDKRTAPGYGIAWSMDLSTLHIRYTITTSVENGTITPSVSGIQYNDDKTISYSPNQNYKLESITVDGSPVDISKYPDGYQFKNITQNHTISVKYTPILHKITTSVVNGTITGSDDKVAHGSNKIISYSPNTNYELESITVDGSPVNISSFPKQYAFNNVTQDHTIVVKYKLILHKITTSVINGTITPGDDKVVNGSSKTISYSPNTDHELESITVDGSPVNIASFPNQYPFNNVTKDHDIQVKYKLIVHKITTNVVNGTITDSDDKVVHRTDKEISYSPNEGYLIDTITVDGKNIDPVSFKDKYMFSNVVTDHVIKVVYTKPASPVKTVVNSSGESINNKYISTEDVLTYNISVKNPLERPVTAVVTDTFPLNTEYVSSSDKGTVSSNTVIWNIPLKAKEDKTVQLRLRVLDDAKGKVVSNSAILNVEGIKIISNQTDNPVPIDPVKTITDKEGKDINQNFISKGQEVNYLITIQNTSKEIKNYTIKDTLPNGMEIINIGNEGKLSEGTIVWSMNLNAGESKTVGMTVRAVNEDTTYKNQAFVFVDNIKLSSNTTENWTPIKPKKDVMQNDASVNGKTIFAGDTVDYYITVKNTSSMPADIRIEDQLSAYLEVKSVSESGTLKNNLITWELKGIPAQATHVVGFSAKLSDLDKDFTVENKAHMSLNNIKLETNNTIVNVTKGHILKVFTEKTIPELLTVFNDPKGDEVKEPEKMIPVNPTPAVVQNTPQENKPVPVSYSEEKNNDDKTQGVLGERKVGTGDSSFIFIFLLIGMCAFSGIIILKIKNAKR